MKKIPIYRSQLIKSDILVVSMGNLQSNKKRQKDLLDRLAKDYPGKLK